MAARQVERREKRQQAGSEEPSYKSCRHTNRLNYSTLSRPEQGACGRIATDRAGMGQAGR
jgi:hypothetical protein